MRIIGLAAQELLGKGDLKVVLTLKEDKERQRQAFNAGALVGMEAAIKVLGIKPTTKRGAPKKVLKPERALAIYVCIERQLLAGKSMTAACKWLAGPSGAPSWRTLLREYQIAREQFNAAGKTAHSAVEKDFITLSLLLEKAKSRERTARPHRPRAGAGDRGLAGEEAAWWERFQSRLPQNLQRRSRDKK